MYYVNQFMTKEVITTPADTPIHVAQTVMRDNRIHRLPVVDEGGKLIGLVTDRRLREVIASLGSLSTTGKPYQPLTTIKVGDVMARNVVIISPDALVSQAANLGRKHGIGALPVVDDGKLVGIITTTDLVRLLEYILRPEGPGAYLYFAGDVGQEKLPEIIEIIHKHKARIKTVFQLKEGEFDIQIDVDDIAPIKGELESRRYSCTIISYSAF